MATQVSSFLLSDGNGTFCAIMKLVMSNKGKHEITTMSCCFRKCGNNGCVPCNASSDGSMPCIVWVASCASLRSKYGDLFLNPFFSKRAFTSPFFSFWQIFATKKNVDVGWANLVFFIWNHTIFLCCVCFSIFHVSLTMWHNYYVLIMIKYFLK